MNAAHLQDRIYWGLNRSANVLGLVTDAYRPRGKSDPVRRSNRYLRLPAAFGRADGNFAQPVGYGVAIWRGYFDGSYTLSGDYLIQQNNIWFIASQQNLMPILCVRTNRIVSVTREQSSVTGAPNDPGNLDPMISVISNWPASLLGTGTEGKPPTRLPGDTMIPTMTALLPVIHGTVLRPKDMVTDEYGTKSIVVAAEASELGWRLNIHQVST